MADFYKEDRRTDDRLLKSAALMGAFEQWRRKREPQIELPRAFRSMFPISIEEIAPHMEEARRRDGHRPYAFESIRACLEHQLEQCKHPHHGRFCRECKRDTGADYSRFGATDTDIDFHPQTFVTTVIVRSVFKDVSKRQAEEIRSMADPPNWDDAAPTFFKETACVVVDPLSGDYEVADPPALGNGNGRPSAGALDYTLFERVEWAWSPLLTGGIINLLEIRPERDDGGKTELALEDVLSKLGMQNHPIRSNEKSGYETLIAYEYSLKKCIQSKLVGGWEPEGLDTDEGSYRAVWLPQNDEMGTLVIRAEKTISYSSKAAELFPGLSALLNMLAPSVTSMLMNHLSFYGPCSYLAMTDEREPKPRRAKPGDAIRRHP